MLPLGVGFSKGVAGGSQSFSPAFDSVKRRTVKVVVIKLENHRTSAGHWPCLPDKRNFCMGFELRFLTKDRRFIDPRELVLWNQQSPYLSARSLPGGLQMVYENPETDVHFSVDYLPDEPCDDAFEIPEGYFDSGLGFSLYYGRPTYFTYEAMPFLVDLARSFELWLFNPQAATLASAAKADELIVSWSECNRQAVRAMAAKGLIDSFYYLPKEKADRLWSYRLSKDRREAALDGKVYFPQIFLFAPKGERQCAAAITWNGAAMAFPEVDYVVLVRREKSLFGFGAPAETIEYVPASSVRNIIGAVLTPLGESDDLAILRPDAAKQKARRLAAMAGKPFANAFTRVPYDAFVDVDFLSREAAA